MSTVHPVYGAVPSGNITLGGSGGNHTISVTGAGGGHVLSVANTTGGTGSTWTTAKTTAQGKLHLEGEGADIVMNGVSLKAILDSITDRLSILQPKPELLAKYEALQQAFDHYKTLEALLHESNND